MESYDDEAYEQDFHQLSLDLIAESGSVVVHSSEALAEALAPTRLP